MKKIRTRYAPSPTGYFHVGGARTALFCYLFAKKNNGDFILRIEDTDVARNVENGIESQYDNLVWLGIEPDESLFKPGKFGPYQQTKKLDRYKQFANQLLEEKKAFRCFCTKEELDSKRETLEKNHQTPKYDKTCAKLTEKEIQEKLDAKIPYTIRLNVDDNESYTWNDMIRGEITVSGEAMTSPVILKSNGICMYNFGVVIDDHDMEISHVLRGEEHISNTPYQLAIAKALGFKNEIIFGHLNIIINETGKKLSKRDEHLKQFIEDYKKMGILPQAIINFMALLGWSPASNKEILTLDEIIKEFDINKVGKAPSTFDVKKLYWISNKYIQALDNQAFLDFSKDFVEIKDDLYVNNSEAWRLVFKNQLNYASELNLLINEYLDTNKKLNNEELSMIATENALTIKKILRELIVNTNDWTVDNIKLIINEIKLKTGLKGKDLFMPIRILATKMSHGPELATIIWLLGKDRVLGNI